MNKMFYNDYKNILMPLEKKGWYFLKSNKNQIVMRKKYEELDEININYNNDLIEFTLPMENPSFSFFKRMKNDEQSFDFFKNYIDFIIYV